MNRIRTTLSPSGNNSVHYFLGSHTLYSVACYLSRVNFWDKKQTGKSDKGEEDEGRAIVGEAEDYDGAEGSDDKSDRTSHTEEADEAGVFVFDVFEKVSFGRDFDDTGANTSREE